ncbi:MAG TPA: hypothetical protein VK846_13435 [Candidatus Limnocylindria bacterium]|nr:hypothetical protein [Candidatus Limnocylindria bacterium]
MKTRILSLVCLTGLSISTFAIPIAQWTFETSVPATAGPVASETGTGIGTAFHANGTTVYSNPTGNGSAESWSADKWAVGDYWQFQVSTINFTDIGLSWDQTSSGTGPRDFAVFWSVTGLVGSFTQFDPLYSVLANASPNPVWSSVTYRPEYNFVKDLTSITALNNAGAVYFRLVDQTTTSAAGGTVASTGTDRIDNFTVTGTPTSANVSETLPLPVTVATLAGLLAVSQLASRRKDHRQPIRIERRSTRRSLQ